MFQVSCGNRKPKDNGVFKPQKVNTINKIEFNLPPPILKLCSFLKYSLL